MKHPGGHIGHIGLFSLLMHASFSPGCGDTEVGAPKILVDVPSTVPTGARWIEHLTQDILPFYLSDEALGTPVGNFPTWRCNDGSVAVLGKNDCEYAKDQDFWIKDAWLEQREYVRMRSRQTFLYGVAYHLTGDERLFELHLAGLEWLRANALDPNGGAYTYFTVDAQGRRTFDSNPATRTSQDQAYAALAFALNYYLTRDPAALADLARLEEYIFGTYWDADKALLRWKTAMQFEPLPGKGDKNYQLAAQIDQLNAYMLMAYPLLPEGPTKSKWAEDIRRVVDALRRDFFSPEYMLFWGEYNTVADRINPPKDEEGNDQNGFGEHTDFGHTTKTFWMTYLAGRALEETEWMDFGREGMAATLAEAYITDATVYPDGAWDYKYDRDAYRGAWAGQFTGKDVQRGEFVHEIYPGNQWWVDAELNQTAATMALDQGSDATYVNYLGTTYPKWFEHRVDPVRHGVFHYVEFCSTAAKWCPPDGRQVKWGKGNLWKGGFHEAEHALMGYITSQALRNEKATLHFALHKDRVNEVLRPYFFSGDVVRKEKRDLSSHPDHQEVVVTFSGIE